MRNVFTKIQDSGHSLNEAVIFRNDTYKVKVVITEENQVLPELRFVAKNSRFGSESAPIIIKSGSDFTTSISVGGNQVVAEFTLEPNDTVGLLGRASLIYDIERTMGGIVTTLEQGHFTVIPDIAI